MQLQVDESHKKIDLTKIDLRKARELGVKIGATALTLFMLSGCGKKKAEEHVEATEYVPETSQEVTMDENTNNEQVYSDVRVEPLYDDGDEYIVAALPKADVKEHDGSELVNNDTIFGLEFDDGRKVSDEDLTYDDLAHVVKCIIIVNDTHDYEFLNHMPNLKEISITDVSNEPKLTNVDGSRLPAGIKISIRSPYGFSRERYGFLRDTEYIDTLEIGDPNMCMPLDNVLLNELMVFDQIHNLKLSLGYDSNYRIGGENLAHLDSLELTGKPYDIAMYVSNEKIDEINRSNVELKIENIEKVREANEKIDEIVANLGVDKDATAQEKLNAVLTYVLNEYSYDPRVATTQLAGREPDKSSIEEFYEDGYLTGGLDKDTQICGNYAAMTTTLLRRLGVTSLNLSSENHAWVAVQIGGYYFYCDPTWLDQEYINYAEWGPNFEEGPEEKRYSERWFAENDKTSIGLFSWYLVDPTEVDEIRTTHTESHVLLTTPSELRIADVPEDYEDEVRYRTPVTQQVTPTPIPSETTQESIEETKIIDDEKIVDISNKEIHININGKTAIIGAAAFVGILAALGGGKLIHEKRKEEERRRRGRYGTSDDPYGDSYRRRY